MDMPNHACISRGMLQGNTIEIDKMKSEDPAYQVIKTLSHGYAQSLQTCTTKRSLGKGKRVHACIILDSFTPGAYLLNTVITMYAECSSMDNADQVFSKMNDHNLFTWTLMIKGYVKQGYPQGSIQLFQQMQEEDIRPDTVTFLCVLNACVSIQNLEWGKSIHAHILRKYCELNLFLGSSFVNLYAQCGCIHLARRLFISLPSQNAVSWTAMIKGYVEHGYGREAIQLYRQMQDEGIEPDQITLVAALAAAASVRMIVYGKWLQCQVLKAPWKSNMFVNNALLDMYGKCGSLQDVQMLLERMPNRDIVSWNTVMAGYAQSENSKDIFKFFRHMQQEGIRLDKVSYSHLLGAVIRIESIAHGYFIHGHTLTSGCVSDIFVASALIDMYMKCGNVNEANRVFNNSSSKNVVMWTTMISGFVQHGDGANALTYFDKMKQEGTKPNLVTLLNILSACAMLSLLEGGQHVHHYISKSEYESEIILGNALIDMYSKCGSIKDAHQVFTKLGSRDFVSWNSIVAAHGQHGNAKEVMQLFWGMQDAGEKPDKLTFISILSLFSHLGHVDQGYHYFELMAEIGIVPIDEHYACLIDLLGRMGLLDEAKDVINTMPSQPGFVVWIAFLGACRMHKNVILAETAIEQALRFGIYGPAVFVLLSNIYAAAGMWNEKAKVRQLIDNSCWENLSVHGGLGTGDILHHLLED